MGLTEARQQEESDYLGAKQGLLKTGYEYSANLNQTQQNLATSALTMNLANLGSQRGMEAQNQLLQASMQNQVNQYQYNQRSSQWGTLAGLGIGALQAFG